MSFSLPSVRNLFVHSILAPFMLLLFSGCTGLKSQSFPAIFETDDKLHRTFYLKETMPRNKSLSIRQFQYNESQASKDCLESGNKIGAHFAEQLKKKLYRTNLFSSIKVISGSEKCDTELVIEGQVLCHKCGLGDWAARVMIPAPNILVLQGKMVNLQNHSEIFNFCLGREAQGGAVGVGGLLSAGSTTMGKKISEWIADSMIILINDCMDNITK